jgi:hypothetical protein
MGQFEETRREDLRLTLPLDEWLDRQIGPGCRHGRPSPRGQLQHDPWLVLPPEHIDPGGELAADAAAILDDPDGSAGEK